MNNNIKRKLKQRTKLIKYFYKNDQMKCDYYKISKKFEECTAEILETKKNCILNMTCKFADSNTAPKTYWTLLNRLLYNTKIQSILPLLADGKFVSDFFEKSNIFNNFFVSVCTPIKNVLPVQKKEDKCFVKSYFPISFVPNFAKVFERVIYNLLFNYFLHNKLFMLSQSAFLPGDSCIAQLLSIIHEMQSAFDDNPIVDVTGIFLDISKAFDKVWHDDLLFKLKTYGVEGDLLLKLKNYLKNRK